MDCLAAPCVWWWNRDPMCRCCGGCAGTSKPSLVARVVDLKSGACRAENALPYDKTSFDGERLRVIYGSRWRLIIVGAGQLSQYLAQMALSADYEVLVVDPREEFSAGWGVPKATFVKGMPDDAIIPLDVDTHTAIVALTHDPEIDDMALLEALKSPAFYVGAQGSLATTAERKARLAPFDLSTEQINRLHGPIGIYIGPRTPPEIAISIMAEITACKNDVPVLQRRELHSKPLAEAAKRINQMSV